MTTAARKLHMTASAISQQIKKLEQEKSLRLFHRNSRQMLLTEAGEVYFRHSIKLLEVAESGQEALERLSEDITGELKIIAPEGFGGGLLSHSLKQLCQQFPKLTISVILEDSENEVLSADAHIVIRFSPYEDHNFTSVHLATWQQILCVSNTHPLADMPPKNPIALSEHAFIAYDFVVHRKLQHHSEQDASLPRPQITVSSMQALIQLVKDGVGFGVLPKTEVQPYLERGDLVHILPQWTLPHYHVYAVTPKNLATQTKTKQAVQYLQSYFADLSSLIKKGKCPF